MAWDSDREDTDWDSFESESGLSTPPIRWLQAGVAAGALGIALALIFWSPWPSAVGYVVGALGSSLLLAVFHQKEANRKARGWSSEDTRGAGLLQVLLFVAWLVAVVANSWIIADALSRRYG